MAGGICTQIQALNANVQSVASTIAFVMLAIAGIGFALGVPLTIAISFYYAKKAKSAITNLKLTTKQKIIVCAPIVLSIILLVLGVITLVSTKYIADMFISLTVSENPCT